MRSAPAFTVLLGVVLQSASHGPEPGPRAGVAGLAGFQSVSRIDFGGKQNRLTAVYVFPDRARWHFENYAALERSEHQFYYRSGERVSELAATTSREMQGAERDRVILQMELRRAVMLWPDGFVWQPGENGTRRATVLADSCCQELPIGTLVASLAEEHLRRAEVRDVRDQLVEALEVRDRQDVGGRSWPRTLALESKDGGFVETIEALETNVRFLELSFVPPDRRALPKKAGAVSGVLSRDLIAMTYATRALPPGIDLGKALELARKLREDALASAKELTFDPVPTFELGPEGRPTCCLLRLATPLFPPPEGFVTKAERPGVFLLLNRQEEVNRGALQALLDALPPSTRQGTPYLRVHSRPSSPLELVLPIEPD